MFKRLVALLVVCCSFSAVASVDAKIAPIFEELEFKLSVEWDQKDQAFYDSAVKNFEGKLSKLAEEGVEPTAVLNYLQTNIKDKKVATELSDIINSVDVQSMSLEESKSLIKDYVDGMNNTGANYSGRYGYYYGWYYIAFGGVIFYTYYYSSYYYYDCYYDYYGYYVCY